MGPATRRMSPRLLQQFLALTGPEVEACFSSLDLDEIRGAVSWAGLDPAPVWFDIAREFTERWHHQQQIRDATHRFPLYDPYFLSPVLETFVRALPYSFRNTIAPPETSVRLEISGEAGGVWWLKRTAEDWDLTLDAAGPAALNVVLPQDAAWRLFTKGIDPGEARSRAKIDGTYELADVLFATTAIIG